MFRAGGDQFSANNSKSDASYYMYAISRRFLPFARPVPDPLRIQPVLRSIRSWKKIYSDRSTPLQMHERARVYASQPENVESSRRLFSLSQVRKILLSRIGHGCKVS